MYKLKLNLVSRFSHWPPEATGADGFYQSIRDTEDYPTERALFGMIECALGYSDEYEIEKRSLEAAISFSDLSKSAINKNKPFRRCYDFVTANPLFEWMQFPTADGKFKNDPPPTTTKVYLTDSDFTVYVYGEKEILEKIAHALDFPKYPYYFGDRKCLPSEPVNGGITEEDS